MHKPKLVFNSHARKEVPITGRVGIYRVGKMDIMAQGEKVGESSEVSSQRDGVAPYNFWVEQDEGKYIVNVKVIESTNALRVQGTEIKQGQVEIDEDCEIHIGHFKFRLEFPNRPTEEEKETISSSESQMKSLGESINEEMGESEKESQDRNRGITF